MTPHAPGCFYYHCAAIDVTADAPPGGGVVVGDAGDVPSNPTTPSDEEDEEGSSGSTSRNRRRLSSQDSSGCAMAPATAQPPFAVIALALVALRRRRRDA